MACSSVPSVLSLKATIAKLQKRVSEIESTSGDSPHQTISEQSRKIKDQEGKDELEEIIEENYNNQILELKFSSATYEWEKKDIYAYCLRHMQAKRKNNKNKSHDCLENTTLEANNGTKEKGIEESIERDDRKVQEMESLCIDTLRTEELDDYYRPKILFDHKSSFEPLLDGLEEDTFYNNDEELTKQGPIMALLQDATQVVQTIEEKTCKSLSVDHHENIGARKSKRTPKWSEKVKDNLKRKQSSSDLSKKKKLKTSKATKSLNEDASMLCLNEHEKDVHVFDKEDEETILMKFLELTTIDALWTSLRSNFNIIKRNADFSGDRNEQSADGMRKSFVNYLLATNKVVVAKHNKSSLSVDNISVVDLY